MFNIYVNIMIISRFVSFRTEINPNIGLSKFQNHKRYLNFIKRSFFTETICNMMSRKRHNNKTRYLHKNKGSHPSCSS